EPAFRNQAFLQAKGQSAWELARAMESGRLQSGAMRQAAQSARPAPAGSAMIPKALPLQAATRIVIDTNVLLDLFVFHDPRWQGLLDALENGSVVAYTREDCACEWRLVLEYPHLPLNADSRAAAQLRFIRL